MRLKPGDKVRLIKCTYGHRYKIGQVVTIKRATNSLCRDGKDEYECKEIIDGHTWYIYTGEYEIIPPQLTLKPKPL